MCTILNQRPLNRSKHSTLSLGGWFGGFFQLEFINKTLGLFIERQVFKPPVCQWPLEERWNKSLRCELGFCTEPFDLHRGVIKSWNISWSHPVHPEPSLLLWPAQGSSQFLLHGLALVWAPSRSQALLGRFLLEKVLFRAKAVARSSCWSKAVAVWGWLCCWAPSGCRDELFVHGQLGCDPGAGTGLGLSLFKLLPSASCFPLAAIQGFLSKWFLNPWSVSHLCMDCYCVWEIWILPRHPP